MSVLHGRMPKRSFRFDFRTKKTRRKWPGLEWLEKRELLANVSINAGDVIRAVNSQLLGVNVAWYDSDLNTSQTQQMVQAAGLTMFRFPGGSSSDDFHFNAGPHLQRRGDRRQHGELHQLGQRRRDGHDRLRFGQPARGGRVPGISERPGRQHDGDRRRPGVERFDQRLATGRLEDGRLLGRDCAPRPRWRKTTASISCASITRPRSASSTGRLATRSTGAGRSTTTPIQHDPATYIAFAKQFQTLAAGIDPTISIGLDVGSPGDFNNWTADILQQSAIQGLMPGFLSDHNYVQAPGSESDSNLLLDTVTDPTSDSSDPGNPYDWAVRAADYENLLTQYLGAAGKNVQLLATEFNSVYSRPRQADHQPGQRPVPGRLARSHARDALRRRRRLGPAEFLSHRRQ